MKKLLIDETKQGEEELYLDALENHFINQGFSEFEANFKAHQLISKKDVF